MNLELKFSIDLVREDSGEVIMYEYYIVKAVGRYFKQIFPP